MRRLWAQRRREKSVGAQEFFASESPGPAERERPKDLKPAQLHAARRSVAGNGRGGSFFPLGAARLWLIENRRAIEHARKCPRMPDPGESSLDDMVSMRRNRLRASARILVHPYASARIL
jgi:hypothetical protein